MDYRIYSVHGTFAADASQRGNRWWQKESRFSDAVLSYLDTENHRIAWEPFRWSGDNKSSERGKAAGELAEVVSRIDLQKNRVVFLAHSHGGNVAYSARRLAKHRHKVAGFPIVTVGTPFMLESHTSSLALEKLLGLWWVFIYAGLACLAGLRHTDPGSLPSKALVITSLLALVMSGFSLYVKFGLGMASRLIAQRHGPVSFLYRKLLRVNEIPRRENPKDPKVYSLNDEAINALRSIPLQKVNLATAEMAMLPAVGVGSCLILFVGAMALLGSGRVLPGDVAPDFASIFGEMDLRVTASLELMSLVALMMVLSCAIGFLCSRLFLAGWFARLLNNQFTKALKERAYGRDGEMNRSLPMLASANLPLLFSTYAGKEEWKPVPKSLDDDLEEISMRSAKGMFRAIRETLGMGMATGSYTFSETISTSFRGEELVHSAYFEHSDMPGFFAWMLCEYYGFPKGGKYKDLPTGKFKTWWDAICPEAWQATGGPGAGDEKPSP